MSRVAKNPVTLPKGVTAATDGTTVTVKGAKGTLALPLRRGLSLVQEGQTVRVEIAERNRESLMHAGSLRSHLANLVHGVSQGYEKKLELVGVGYRAQAQGRSLNLTLGFSHPVVYPVPEGITVETPTQTEILIKGADKQQVGQVAAEIRAYRAPEPYKGKGVRYSGERIELKETKKK
jgi:large subunit ribosomal protein L6